LEVVSKVVYTVYVLMDKAANVGEDLLLAHRIELMKGGLVYCPPLLALQLVVRTPVYILDIHDLPYIWVR